VFTARYGLSPYIKQTRLVFKGLISVIKYVSLTAFVCWCIECKKMHDIHNVNIAEVLRLL
jgi:hypothetical protein